MVEVKVCGFFAFFGTKLASKAFEVNAVLIDCVIASSDLDIDTINQSILRHECRFQIGSVLSETTNSTNHVGFCDSVSNVRCTFEVPIITL